jgi:hypothetical protein
MAEYAPEVPRTGIYKITVDNSPFPLEGKTFSYSQIMLALQNGTFRPGMKFRHLKLKRVEYLLTASGLMAVKRKQHSSAAEEETDDQD